MSTGDAIVMTLALASTWAMAGVIWVIQLVHYPAFDAIERGPDDSAWVAYGERHRAGISFVVGPFMATEGATGIWIVVSPPGDASLVLPLVAFALMGVAYGVTAFVSVPYHERLTHRFDADALRGLIRTNWWRTAAWTLRGIVLGVLLVVAV